MPITEEKRVKDFPPRQSGLLPADVIPVDSNAGGTGSVTVQQLMEANISGLTTDATTVIAAVNELKAQAFKTIALTQAQYDLLPDTKLTDGISYYITDGVPDVDNSLWTKVGTDPLDTTASDCSGAINELKSSLSQLDIDLTMSDNSTSHLNKFGRVVTIEYYNNTNTTKAGVTGQLPSGAFDGRIRQLKYTNTSIYINEQGAFAIDANGWARLTATFVLNS